MSSQREPALPPTSGAMSARNHDLANRPDVEMRVERVLEQVGQRPHMVDEAVVRLGRQHFAARALAARQHALLDQPAQRLAHGVAADAELAAQLDLGRQIAADLVAALDDALAQQGIDLAVARLFVGCVRG